MTYNNMTEMPKSAIKSTNNAAVQSLHCPSAHEGRVGAFERSDWSLIVAAFK